MRRAVAASIGTLALLAATSACSDPSGAATADDTGSGGQGTASSSASAGAGSADAVTIDVTFDGDSVEPNGERIAVEVGQEVDLVVTADEPGEIHVHSSPEQELEYEGGDTPTTFELSFDRPGIVEVESHSLDKQIVSLEVG